MIPTTTFVVAPTMPAPLVPLKELAYNYWWCWHKEAVDLFRRMNPSLWEETHHNPVAMLSRLTHDRLVQLSQRPDFVSDLQNVYREFRTYMDEAGWYASVRPHSASYIAYFCAEFGIHESFSSYSGGLGVLAGDHLKSASDLGLPLVAVGLLYQEGYFRQYLTQNGWQQEQYVEQDFHDLAIHRVMLANGSPMLVSVNLPEGTAHAQIWRMSVGRIPLYLLDTNIPENPTEELRSISDRLYGGDSETRIKQEILLGIGGMRALQALGIEPAAVHLNEGHAAFATLERSRIFMTQLGLDFRQAWQVTAASTVFTTHTPVPAGNEVFTHDLLEEHFATYAKGLGLTWDEFMALGATGTPDNTVGFSMTILGIRGSSARNGVSKLHGEVARQMWRSVWSDFELNEIPIGSVTNGVHIETWVAPEIADLYDRYLGPQWRSEPDNRQLWENVHNIPSIELWRAHQRRRDRLVIGAREHILSKHSTSLTQSQIAHIHNFLDPDVLTIGFARRFATYKRADLLMWDVERLARIVNNADRPVQFILAGKAHPRDNAGKELIQTVHSKIAEHGLAGRIVFLEDYNMDVARLMVRGCDIWLNTPRKPYEASGTSGMKAAVNGCLHFSILDGWWAEAYDGENGFCIGRGESFEPEEQDAADALTLYDILEHVIIPMHYDISNGGKVPERWVAMMKRSIASLAWQFSAHRMVKDYTVGSYTGAMDRFKEMTQDNAAAARNLVAFFTKVRSSWNELSIRDATIFGTNNASVGSVVEVQAAVSRAGIEPEHLLVQAVYGRVNSRGVIVNPSYLTLTPIKTENGTTHYSGLFNCNSSGEIGCAVRVLPAHPAAANPADAGLVHYSTSVTRA
ncbi:MAG: glycosyltransferase family 1 protein [Chlorobi bacterium]|nr:MAG: glycosyltransferase family 1 protein [Bacteroidota bacterium]MBL1162102.1 glycosyltransferase family 1 protein [Chlorobiota bacterium]MBW7854579.1 alpha-glucan family phosphorylase [Candidatus Kapabacteria bacterium]MCC6331940.1 alpha-glucan family phosphorylase [Ignavibacteria bacterium]MBV6463697.1 Glycogen phosphorylase [Chlorobiota bacterium]